MSHRLQEPFSATVSFRAFINPLQELNIHVWTWEPVQGGKAKAGVFNQYRTPDLNSIRYLPLGFGNLGKYTSSAALRHLSVEISSIVP